MATQPTGTVTLLFTDIEGSTRLLQELGQARYAESLDLHRRLLRGVFEAQGGYEVDCEGDAFFVAFSRAEDAIAAADEAQQALANAEWPEGIELRVRMGVHTGEPLAVPPNYVGLDVHKAARIMAAGHGGQVLLSEATRQLVGPSDVASLGEHRLKDLLQPEPLYQLRIEGLPAEFPALKTLGSQPTNLPVQPNALIGREREVGEVSALLGDGQQRLVTLTGPGGTGKTRLALQVAAELVGDFESGVFFVPLAAVRDAGLVVPTIAQTLAVRELPGEPLEDTLGAYLERKRMLLLLDNLEQLVDAAPALAALASRCAELVLLVTSRERLRLSAERVYEVPPLPVEDPAASFERLRASEAVMLFGARSEAVTGRSVLDEETVPVVAAICARLDGLPLAIELAAGRTRALAPEAILRRLDRRLTILTGGGRDLAERQRTLRDTIAWSYELLSSEEQAVFSSLSVFAAGCRLDAAEAVCDLSGAAGLGILDALTSLCEKNLVRQRPDADREPRYWMLETIREDALEMLHERGGFEAAAGRHAAHFLELAEWVELESRTGEESEWFGQLDAELPNLRVALEWAETSGDAETVLRLATALWRYWYARGHLSEGIRRLEQVVAPMENPPARAILGLCMLRQLASADVQELTEGARQALRGFEQAGDEFGLAQVWNLIGVLEGSILGRFSAADQACERALDYAERGGYRSERAESMGWLMINAIFGPLPADQGIRRCTDFFERAGDDPKVRAFAQVERSVLEAMRGEFELARGLLAEGTRAFESLGLNVWAANNGQEGFFVEMLAGNPHGASTMLRKSYEALESMGELSFLSTIAGMLAQALAAEREDAEAESFARKGEHAAAADDVTSQVLWRCARAKVLARRGDLMQAEGLAREAVAIAAPTELLNGQADALMDLAEVLQLALKSGEALAAVEAAAEKYDQKGNLVSLARAQQQARALRAG
jgi:predicted ATPase/class 3 adenylate cyclase